MSRQACGQTQACSPGPCHPPRCPLLLTQRSNGQAFPPMTVVEAKLGLAGSGQDFSGLAKTLRGRRPVVHIGFAFIGLCQVLY